MNIFNKKSLKQLSVFISSALFSVSTFSLTELTDEEMTDISGQASLLSIDKYDYAGNNFYQVKVNAEVETSVNIDRLLLSDGGGNAQIDIEDLSISGGVNNAVTSATMTNPFVEFAFAGSIDGTDARTREIIGIRVGADGMSGVMSFGEQNANPNLDTGINTFSGFMRTNSLSGTANTNALTNAGPFNLQAAVRIIGINSTMSMTNAEITVPAISAAFTADPVEVSGTGLTSTTIVTNIIDVSPFNYSARGSGEVSIPAPFGGSIDLTGYMQRASGVMSNLRMIGTVTQDLKTIHKASIDSGFYLSAQNEAIDWRGSDAADTAQAGWWMGFSGPVNLDPITLNSVDLPDATLQEILDRASTYLLANPISLGLFDAVAALGPPGVIVDNVDVDLGGASPAPLSLSNQFLGASQSPVINCWNGSIGC